MDSRGKHSSPIRLLAAWLLLALIILHTLHKFVAQRQFFRKLPGPPHSFLYGHLPIMFKIATRFPPGTHPQFFYTEIARQYNLQGLWYLDLWPFAPGCVVLNDPDLHEEVTVGNPLPVHRIADSVIAPIVGKGAIVTNNGALWKRLHRMMAPAFSWKHVRDMTGIIVEECELFDKTLRKRAGTGAPFSMLDLTSKLIFDIMARTVFNARVHAQTTGSQYLADLHEMIHLAEGQLTDPMVAYNPVKRLQVWWRKRQISKTLDASFRDLVNQRLNLLREQQGVPSRRDPSSILDLMLREHVVASVGEGEAEMATYRLPKEDMELILANLKGALMGAHGTTTDTLCYALMLLTKYPDCLSKMRKEHDEIFSSCSSVTKEMLSSTPCKLQDLHYTEAVLREVVRLFPLGMPLREAQPGSSIHRDGQDLPIGANGMVIALNTQDIHYNPEFYTNPSDFQPERWLNPEKPIPKENFRPFSRGNRTCLGMNLAMNLMKMVLVMVARDFDFRCAGLRPNPKTRADFVKLDETFGDVVFQEIGLEAKPRGPMRMLVKKRRKV